MSKHILLSGCHHVKSSHYQQLRPKSKACTPPLKMPPSVHLRRPAGTGTLQLGCLVAADTATSKTTPLLSLCSSGASARMCQCGTETARAPAMLLTLGVPLSLWSALC